MPAFTPEYRILQNRYMAIAMFVGVFNVLVLDDDHLCKYFPHLVDTCRREQVIQACERVWLELMACQSVDTLMYYITQMLRCVFVQYPGRLGETEVKLGEVLECKTKNELIQRIADRKVHSLSYRGLRGVFSYLNRELGLEFDLDTQEFQEISEFFEVRNIVVHNAGLVSPSFLERTGRADLRIGDPYPLTIEYVTGISMKLLYFSQALDAKFVSHFGLAHSADAVVT